MGAGAEVEAKGFSRTEEEEEEEEKADTM